ncbi:prophage PssSM-03 [Pseudomonas fluorescens]|uniref:Prophage PssSM-03 n=2 Tax=Pseudomonas fluorescens TaxID=294 RepID=A0AAE2A3I1_PSEFL|nr:prophage PssSM-03 [Pseudomonas fluorescens]
MALFGLRVFDENGFLAMDTNSFTYQVLWQGVIDFSGATPSYTLNIPGFDPANCVFMIIPTRAQDVQSSELDGSGNAKSYPFVTTAVGQVVVRPKNPSSSASTLQTRIVAKGYAIRYGT